MSSHMTTDEQRRAPSLEGSSGNEWLAPIDLSLAVVVPVRNEAAAIGECLDAILGGSVEPNEVLVVDGQSTDGTQAIVAAYSRSDSRVRLLDNPARTIPSALNIGWRSTRCSLVARVDGHSQISPTYLERVQQNLASSQWQGVGGRKEPVGTTAVGRTVAAAMGSRWGVGNSRYHYSTSPEQTEHVPFGAYPRAVVELAGGWDEELLVNQDFEFDYRLGSHGGRILFDPAMNSRWACSSTLRDLAHQYHRYGRGKVRVAMKHPRSVRARHLAPPAVPLALLGGVILGLTGHRRLAVSVLATYVGASAVSAMVGKASTLPLAERLRFPIVIATMHNAWGLGALHGLVDVLRTGSGGDPYRYRWLPVADVALDPTVP